MKIAFVIEEFPKISETFVLNQATGLIDLGHEVDIFYFKIGDTKVMHSDIQKYGLLEKAVCLDPLPSVTECVREIRSALDKKFPKDTGIRLPFLDLFRFLRDTVSPLLLFRSSLLDGKGKYNIIHCQFGTVALRFLPLYRLRILDGKLIVQFRGHDLTEFIKQKGDRVYSKLFREADYFLPVCDYLRKRAVALGCPEDKVSIMKSVVDLKQFKFNERKKPSNGPIRIVFVGRLVEKKGVEYAIRALSILKKQSYNVELLIVGDGPLKNNLESQHFIYYTLIDTKNHDKEISFVFDSSSNFNFCCRFNIFKQQPKRQSF